MNRGGTLRPRCVNDFFSFNRHQERKEKRCGEIKERVFQVQREGVIKATGRGNSCWGVGATEGWNFEEATCAGTTFHVGICASCAGVSPAKKYRFVLVTCCGNMGGGGSVGIYHNCYTLSNFSNESTPLLKIFCMQLSKGKYCFFHFAIRDL